MVMKEFVRTVMRIVLSYWSELVSSSSSIRMRWYLHDQEVANDQKQNHERSP